MFRRALTVVLAGVVLGVGGYAASAGSQPFGGGRSVALCAVPATSTRSSAANTSASVPESSAPRVTNPTMSATASPVWMVISRTAHRRQRRSDNNANYYRESNDNDRHLNSDDDSNDDHSTATTTATTTTARRHPPARSQPPGAVSARARSHVLVSSRSQVSRCTRGVLPDRHCSPGAYYSGLTKAVICSSTFRTGTIRNVPDSEKHQVEVEYGMTPKAYGRTIEIDHIVSLETRRLERHRQPLPRARLRAGELPRQGQAREQAARPRLRRDR